MRRLQVYRYKVKSISYAIPASTSFLNCRTIGSMPPSSTTKPRLNGYVLSKAAGQEETIRLLIGSSLNFTRSRAFWPPTFKSASSSSLTLAVKPGRQTTRVCGRNFSAGTCLAMTKFLMVVSGDASHAFRDESSGESRELPMGQIASCPFRGSRMIPGEN